MCPQIPSSKNSSPAARKIGLISDTHGRFRDSLIPFLNSCTNVIHAGDIADEGLLTELQAFAPISAVLGNNDRWLDLPETRVHQIGRLKIAVVHDLGTPESPRLRISQVIARETPRLVVHGHTHIPDIQEISGIVYVNPGSAGGLGRGQYSCSAAQVHLFQDFWEVQIVTRSGAAPEPVGTPISFPIFSLTRNNYSRRISE